MSASNADRNLLFGVLALQMDFISQEALLTSLRAWMTEKSKALGQILLEQGALRPDTHALLEALVAKHLEQHGGDAQQSLATISSADAVREQLSKIFDSDLEASILRLGRDRPPAADPHVTEPWTVGTRTSEGTRFRILRPHARGGLGQVSIAHDEELRREVALKEIQPLRANDPESRSRFLLEAEITGGLEHPGIVPVYGLGTYADGRPYYAMRFIRGDSLSEAIARFHVGRLSNPPDKHGRTGSPSYVSLDFRKLLGRLIDVCNAIEYAHSRGILHRDLKPGNIMLGKYGETLVVDWGLAKAVGHRESTPASDEATLIPSSGSASAPTQMGVALGTPAYMSPEQAVGRLDQLGPTTDVYSLGATLYTLLTGQAPFADQDRTDILRRVSTGAFSHPRQLDRRIPTALEAICLKAMRLRPEDRYASPRAFADDLEHWLADEPTVALPDGASARLARWSRRHRAWVRAGAAAVLLMAVVSSAALFVVNGARQQESEAKTAAQRAQQQEQQARRSAEAAQRQAEASAIEARWAAVDGFHKAAEANRAQIKLLRQSPDAARHREQVLDTIRRTVAMRHDARTTLAELPEQPDRREGELAFWNETHDELRDEAISWLKGVHLLQSRTIVLPFVESDWHATQQEPLIAVSPNGQTLALARGSFSPASFQGGPNVRLLNLDGTVQKELEIPGPGPVISAPFNPPALRFVDDDHLEFTSFTDAIIWTLPEGIAERRRVARPVAAPLASTPASKVANSHYEATLEEISLPRSKKEIVLVVRPLADPSVRKTFRFTVETESSAASGIRRGSPPMPMRFGSNPRALFVLVRERLYVVDAEGTGSASVPLESTPNRTDRPYRTLIPFLKGVAVFEHDARQKSSRLLLWDAQMPSSAALSLSNTNGATSIDLSEGRLIAGYRDGSVRVWSESNLIWSLEKPSDREYLTSGSVSLYGMRFMAEGSEGLVVGREVYDYETGQSMHRFPSSGPGKRVAISPDGRWAVLLAEQSPNRELPENAAGTEPWMLSLWSFAELKEVKRLGPYSLLKASIEEGRSGLGVEFSPDSRWLLLDNQVESVCEIWNVTDATCVGKVPLAAPAGTSVFAKTRPRVLKFHGKRATVIDLQTAASVCELSTPASDRMSFGSRFSPRFNFAVALSSEIPADRFKGSSPSPYRATLWNLETGTATALGESMRWTESTFEGRVQAQFNAEENRVLLLGPGIGSDESREPGRAELWALETAKLLRSHETKSIYSDSGFTSNVRSNESTVSFRMATGSFDNLWRWDDGTDASSIATSPQNAASLHISGDGEIAESLRQDEKGLFLQAPGKNRVDLMGTPGSPAANGTYLISVSKNIPVGNCIHLTIRQGEQSLDGIWDVASGQLVMDIPESHTFHGFDPTGRFCVTKSERLLEVGIWDVPAGTLRHRLQPPWLLPGESQRGGPYYGSNPYAPYAILHPRGDHLAVSANGSYFLWDASANKLVAHVPRTFPSDAVAKENSFLAVVQLPNTVWSTDGVSGNILHWSANDGRFLRTVVAHRGIIAALVTDPDKRSVASASRGGGVSLWNENGERLWSFREPVSEAVIQALVFHPSAQILAVLTDQGHVLFLDTRTGKLSGRLLLGQPATCLAFSSDGSWLAAGSASGEVRLWNTDPSKQRLLCQAGSPVHQVTFLDSGHLAIASNNIQIWELSSGKRDLLLPVGNPPVSTVAFDSQSQELCFVNQIGEIASYKMQELSDELQQLGLDGWKPSDRQQSTVNSGSQWNVVLREHEREFDRAFQLLVDRAGEEAKAREWTKAVASLTRAMTMKPGQVQLLRQRAVARFQSGQAGQAVQDWAAVLQLVPNDWQALVERGRAYNQILYPAPAVSDLTAALEQRPDHAESWVLRGMARARLKKPEVALADFDKAVELSPEYVDAYVGRCHALSQLARWQDAKQTAERALKLAEVQAAQDETDPQVKERLASAHNSLAWLLATCPDDALRNGAKALESALRACDLTDSKNHEYLETLAAAQAETGDFAEAEKTQSLAMKLQQTSESYQRQKLYQQKKPFRQAPN